jgi:transcriptional regulator with XRE-family HTH domain
MSCGKLIRNARKALGLTQKELASSVGVSRTFICKVEAQEELPGDDLVIGLAGSLGIMPAVLLEKVRQERLERKYHRVTARQARLEVSLWLCPEDGSTNRRADEVEILQEIIRQLRDGSLTLGHLKDLAEHRNPFRQAKTKR